ncbi:hypothetical protein Ae201684P_012879 [Aphanomyces euteiches]|uniref:Uncharacterized protein n=1 Tax=Aphanomyces euteiches TaxID=100861 RepID=A0A6G0XGC9_9STRA|nr:hypothetical protein Ae201684_005099 [Aphanomyces euteiches]KAF0739174.1 hypothetical protein Ae201684_005100 [Aphanomyces euteiches]KAH9080723.1 hypothetical protein Ae201684P_012863 [Aphanomyces euteiches]KAH9080739.1 hypothetical protein Ae201684P_012879 [Aphanomyces euteiches]KAH9143822.1 hypothetical protein AeRB84_012210 [Aphanomyces euteiches]
MMLKLQGLVLVLVALLQASREGQRVESMPMAQLDSGLDENPSGRVALRGLKAEGLKNDAVMFFKKSKNKQNAAAIVCAEIAKFANGQRAHCASATKSSCSVPGYVFLTNTYGNDARQFKDVAYVNQCGTCADVIDAIRYGCQASAKTDRKAAKTKPKL